MMVCGSSLGRRLSDECTGKLTEPRASADLDLPACQSKMMGFDDYASGVKLRVS